MNEATAGRWKQAVTWLIAIIFSGLGGAVLNNWIANRSTTIEYTINRTALGTDQTAVVPDFQVGGASLQSLYIYSVKLQYSSGPELENAKVGIDLLTPHVKLVGKTVPEGPSEVFRISCEPFESRPKSSGTICSLGRLSSNVGAYTVSFATDADAKINVSIDAKNTQLKQAGIPGAGTPDHWPSGVIFVLVSVLVPLFAAVIGFYFGSPHSDGSAARAGAIELAAEDAQPKLAVDYEGTEANRVDVHYKENQTDIDEIYIRVRVRNLGTRTAKGARVFLTSLREVQNSGATTPTALYDSLALAWAGWGFEPRDIPKGICFYADLMRVSKNTPGWLLSVERTFASHAPMANYSGTYRFQVTVTADNAAPAICEVDVTYNQDWHSLRAVAVQKPSDSRT